MPDPEPDAEGRPGGYRFMGPAETVQRTERGLLLQGSGASLSVEVLAPDLARIRFSPPRPRGPSSPRSFAVIKTDWPATPVTFHEQGRNIALQTGQMVLVVDTHTPGVSCFRPEGSPVVEDARPYAMGWRRGGVICRKRLPPDLHFYGLGEKTGFLDRRGRKFVMWNTDVAPHLPGTDPLYASIPFLIGFRNGSAYGLFFDNTFRTRFDLGYTEPDVYSFAADAGVLDYYLFAGPSLVQVLERYTELTGRMPLPPLWALGYHQSRYSYGDEQQVREVAQALRARKIPCDAIYLDIDYMDGYRVFTFDRRRFPDPARLIADLRRQGFRAVAIVDPGVKADPSYPVYREGEEKGYWAVWNDGRPYVGKVWPGDVSFPDFSRPEVRTWWAGWHRALFQAGVSGIWNDMNEPAAFEEKDKTLPLEVEFGPDAHPLTHAEVHNVYGQLMAEATHEAFARYRPGLRPFVLSRAGYAGIQRYAALWTGDNSSWWEHLLQTIPMCLSLGLSGVPFVGADVGGFLEDCDGELLARWTQMGAFIPFFRNHSVVGSRRQEPYAFGEPYESICRRYIELRYRLLPYLYTLARQAAEHGIPMMRPLVLEFPTDPRTWRLSDQFLLGPYLLVAPVYLPGAASRSVYLPEGTWVNFWTGQESDGGRHVQVDAPLDTLPLFVRRGATLPLAPPVQHTGRLFRKLDLVDLYPGLEGHFALYLDDGETLAYRSGDFGFIHFRHRSEENGVSVEVKAEGNYTPKGYTLGLIRVSGQAAPPREVRLNGRSLPPVPGRGRLARGEQGWHYDGAEHRLYVGVHLPAVELELRVRG